LKACILKLLNKKALKAGTLTPWFRGYQGNIARDPETFQVTTTGILEVVNTTTIKITELPINVQVDAYKAHLEKLEDKELISSYDDLSDKDGFEFIIKCPRSTTNRPKEELLKLFKMTSKETENFTVWASDGSLTRFASAEAIIENFVEWRLGQYEMRRLKLIEITEADIKWLNEQVRFIKYFLANTSKFRNTAKKELIELLLSEKFTEYDRLLGMPLWSLTKDRVEDLLGKLSEKKKDLAELKADTKIAMYERELKAFTFKETE
jgi:DNA topoisomerase-2